MHKRLRIIVPAVQVLIVLAAFILPNLTHGNSQHLPDIFALQNLVLKLNFPLVVIWSPVFYALDRLSPYLPPLHGVFFAMAVILVGSLLCSTVALLWYFVMTEIEMRRHGKSMLRPTGWFKKLLIAGLLFCFGVGTIIHAYFYAKSFFYFRPSQAVLGGFLLLAWGTTCARIAGHDLLVGNKNRGV